MTVSELIIIDHHSAEGRTVNVGVTVPTFLPVHVLQVRLKGFLDGHSSAEGPYYSFLGKRVCLFFE